jgi:phosphoenolpyruvate synthase/pyruvate phosphate dikinase
MKVEYEDYVSWAENVNIDFSKSTLDELHKYINDFFEHYKRALSIIFLPFDMEKVLVEDISSKLPSDKSEEYLHIFSFPLSPSESFEQQLDLLKIANTKNKANIQTELKKHWKKYNWLGMLALRGEIYSLTHFKNEVRQFINPELLLREKRLVFKKQQELIQKSLYKINANQELKKQVRYLRELIYLRTWRLEQINKANALIRPLLEEVSSRFSLSYDDFIWLIPDEINKLFTENKIPKQKIKQRQQMWAIIFDNLSINTFEGEEAKKHFNEENISGDEITGQIAQKGIATGKAKIVKERKDFSKINEGDILVTGMTTPDFLPIMKKASAIITDIGGVTCHAAIVSRELEIPCVIGTNVATKVINDNDIVKVDANKGIIVIIKKSNE